jgi:hypothetical protein
MNVTSLTRRATVTEGSKLAKRYDSLEKVLNVLEMRDLSPETETFINQQVTALNAFTGSDKKLRTELQKTRHRLVSKVKSAEKLVPKNHYRNQWMALGMSAFGIPLGVALGTALGSMAFLGLGLPIGMMIGLAMGTSMDQKAAKEGRQLDLDIEL